MRVARVLWFSERDGNGIIKTLEGDEFYIDISVIPNRKNLKPRQLVKFKVNTKIKDTKCAIIKKIGT